MYAPCVLNLQPASPCLGAARAKAGHWSLGARQALSLLPQRRSVLLVAHGGLWLTVSGPGVVSQDHFLRSGETWLVHAGQRAVLEPWPRDEPVAFSWDVAVDAPLVPAVGGGASVSRPSARDEWQRSVGQPWAELGCRVRAGRQAVWGVCLASGQLVRGLLRFAVLRGKVWGDCAAPSGPSVTH